MTRLTAYCQVAALGVNAQRDRGVYQKILSEFLKVLEEKEMSAIQLVPEGWPVKCKVTVRDESIKEKIVREGLDLFGKHVDFEDDNDLLIKIIVKDGHPEWPDDVFAANLCDYAKTVFTEKEMLYLDGRKTQISTGTRYVYATEITKHIPPKIDFRIEDRLFSVTVWCPNTHNKAPEDFSNVSDSKATVKKSCPQCGADHGDDKCPHEKKVCFTCKKDDHSNRDCPENKGVKQNEHALLFYNNKCPLSNWSVEFPFIVDHITYSCVEQFMTVEKCFHFREPVLARKAMDMSNPKEIRDLGDKIRNFDPREWIGMRNELMKVALEHKFSDPANIGAREYLLDTGSRVIGEASKHKYWGAGLLASDPDPLNLENWTGNNVLGLYLMKIRDDLIAEKVRKMNRNKPGKSGTNSSNENANNSSSSVSSVSDLAATTSNTFAVVLGDGNVPKDISQDSDLPLKVVDLSKGGMKLKDVKDEVNRCMVPKEDVEFVVFHLGSGQWIENEPVQSADSVFTEMEDTVNQVCKVFPKAEFVISEVLLRDPSHAVEGVDKLKEINEEIGKLNQKLEVFARINRTVTLCTNDNILISEKQSGEALKHYENTMQLNDVGRSLLLQNLRKGMLDAIKLNVMSGGEWQQQKKAGGKAVPH